MDIKQKIVRLKTKAKSVLSLATLLALFLSATVPPPDAFAYSNSCTTDGVIHPGTSLTVNSGDIVSLSGEIWCDTVTINGTVNVTPWNGTDPTTGNIGTGRLVIHANSETVGSTGKIDATGAGFSQTAGEYSASFDGNSSDYVGAGTGVNVSSAVTVDAWIKTGSTVPEEMIAGKMASSCFTTGAAASSYGLYIDASGFLNFTVSTGTICRAITSSVSLQPNTTYFVAGTYDGSNTKAYVNGQLVGTSTAVAGSTASTTTPFEIGGGPDGQSTATSNPFIGQIDEVRVSNNVRYTTNFIPPTSEFVSDTNTVGLWHFNEGSGTSTADSSGNGNTATLNGNVTWSQQLAGIALGGRAGRGGAGATSANSQGSSGSNSFAGQAGTAGSGSGAGIGGTAPSPGAGGIPGAAGGFGAGIAGVATNGNAGGNGQYGSSADSSTDQNLLMGASGGSGAAGSGGGGGGGGGSGTASGNGGNGGNGGIGGNGGWGGAGGGFVKLYSTGAISISGTVITKGSPGSTGGSGTVGFAGSGGTGTGAGSGGAGGCSNCSGSGGNNASNGTLGGGGGAGGAGGENGKSGGAGSGGGILLYSDTPGGISLTGTLDASGGGGLTGTNAGTIKVFYACSSPSVGSNNGRVYTSALTPTFNGINPTSGPSSGGQSVTVTGQHFCGSTGAKPNISLGNAQDPSSAPTATGNAGTSANNNLWSSGQNVSYMYTAKVGGNETDPSPIGSVTGANSVDDPSTAPTLTDAGTGIKEQGGSPPYSVGDTVNYEYAANNGTGSTNVSSATSHTVVNTVSNVSLPGSNGCGSANSAFATSSFTTNSNYWGWVTFKVYPTQTDFNNDTNATETLGGVGCNFIGTPDWEVYGFNLPNFTCSTPGSNGCLWNKGRIRLWFNTSNNFSTASLDNTATLSTSFTDTSSCTNGGAGFALGSACGTDSFEASFDGAAVSIAIKGDTATPAPARPTSNTTGAQQVNVTVPAPPTGLSSFATQQGLLYRKVNAGSYGLVDTHNSYTAGYAVNDTGLTSGAPPPSSNTTGVQSIGLSWSAVSGARGYQLYRCVGSPCTASTSFSLIAAPTMTSLTDSGIIATSQHPPSSNSDLCQVSSVSADGSTAVCTTTPHPAGVVSLQFTNNQPTTSANSFTQASAYTYTASDTQAPTQPGTPSSSDAASITTPTWTWTAATDNVAVDHYVIQWCANISFTGCSSNTATAVSNRYTQAAALSDGTWFARIQAFDIDGNTSSYSDTGAHVVKASSSDVTAPSVPGTPSTASPTTNQTPTWTWPASTDNVAVAYYQICWDTTSGGCTYSGVSTTNSFTHTTQLAAGMWYAKVQAYDTSGNSSGYSTVGSVVIQINDTTAPTITNNCGALGAASPCEQTTWFNSTPPNIYDVDFADTGGSHLADFQVESCTAAGQTGTCTAFTNVVTGINSDSYTTNWSVPSAFFNSLPEGTNYITVKAFDNAGNSTILADAFQIKKDTVDPSIPASPTIANPTSNNHPTFSWSASTDATSGIASYTVQWSQDSSFVSGVHSDTVTGTSCQLSTTTCGGVGGLVDGTWYVRVASNDNSGNSSVFTANSTTTIDTTAPSVPGAPATTSPTSNTKPTWTWTASTDSGTGVDHYVVCWDTVSGGCANSVNSASNSYTHTVALADGTWYFKVQAVDAAGNASAFSSVGSVLVDTTAPSTPGTPSTTSPTSNNTPTWTWTASTDSGTGVDHYIVCWDTVSGGCANTSTATTNSFTQPRSLADGTWYFKVQAVDAAGNAGSFSGVGAVIIDTTAPSTPGTPSTTSPTSNNTPTWTWTAATDSGTGVDHYIVCWDTVSGGCANTSTATANSFTQPSGLADGTWYFKIQAVDAAGNKSAFSLVGQVVVDTTAPTQPGTPGSSSAANNNTPTWTWTAATDSGTGVDHYVIEWCTNANFLSCGAGSGNATVTTNTFTHTGALPDGTWYARVRAFDAVGNSSSYSQTGAHVVNTTTSDTTPPTVPGTPSTTSPTSNNTPTWTWTASTDNVAVSFYEVCWDTVSGGCTNSASVSSNTFTHTMALADGTWYFKVQAVDSSGNRSSFSQVGSVLVDTTAPSTPGTPSTANPTTNQTPTWTWTASADSGTGVDHYIVCWDTVYGGCANTATVTTNSFTHTANLAVGTWYFKVQAVDVTGNTSGFSGVGSVQIQAQGTGGGSTGNSGSNTSPNQPAPSPLATSQSSLQTTPSSTINQPATSNTPESQNQPVTATPVPGPTTAASPLQVLFSLVSKLAQPGLLFAVILILGFGVSRHYVNRPRVMLVTGQNELRLVLMKMGAQFLASVRFSVSPPRLWDNLKRGAVDWQSLALQPARPAIDSGVAASADGQPVVDVAETVDQVLTEALDVAEQVTPAAPVTMVEPTDSGFDYVLQSADGNSFKLLSLQVGAPAETSTGDISFGVTVRVATVQQAPAAEIKWQVTDQRSWWRRVLAVGPKLGQAGWLVSGRIDDSEV